MKFLNEILIEWDNSDVEDNGIISQSETSRRLTGLSWEDWQEKYILDNLSENHFSDITEKEFLEKKNFLNDRGVFKTFYEIVNPYSEEFFKISKKMMEHILMTSASGPRAMLNYVFHSLLFGYPPENFNIDAGVRIRIDYEKFYKQLLTKSDQTILNNIYKYIRLDEISPQDLLMSVNEWNPDDGSILDIIMFFKPFEEIKNIYRYLT